MSPEFEKVQASIEAVILEKSPREAAAGIARIFESEMKRMVGLWREDIQKLGATASYHLKDLGEFARINKLAEAAAAKAEGLLEAHTLFNSTDANEFEDQLMERVRNYASDAEGYLALMRIHST